MPSRSSKELFDEDLNGSNEAMLEQRSFRGRKYQKIGKATTDSNVSMFTKIMAVTNLLLGIMLAFSLGFVAHRQTTECAPKEADVFQPWSPALEAIVPTIKKFKPQLIFQSETTPEVEDAWKAILGPSDGLVALDAETSAKLAQASHESAESTFEPGKHVYGISMFHQLHCLNVIRKSFYREKFYSMVDDVHFNHHKNHCIDFLRQAIMCHGDVQMTYWWNKNYTISDPKTGHQSHSDWFNSMTIDERAKNSSTMWDIEHRCHMFEPIEKWVKEHAVLPPGISFPEDPSQG